MTSDCWRGRHLCPSSLQHSLRGCGTCIRCPQVVLVAVMVTHVPLDSGGSLLNVQVGLWKGCGGPGTCAPPREQQEMLLAD